MSLAECKGTMTYEDVTTAIETALERWPEDSQTINNGLCGDFAESACGDLPENGKESVKIVGTRLHTWIYFDGFHFDAEAPEGVPHASRLPIFQRVRQQTDPTWGEELRRLVRFNKRRNDRDYGLDAQIRRERPYLV